MNLHQIELFVAIVESGSFSRAAEKSSLNQSTVSQHIAALEEEFNSPLLDRTPKGVIPTASGKVFLRHARRILNERDTLHQAMSQFSGLEDTELKIGASNIPANYLIPALLPPLSEQYPGIRLNMKSGDSKEIIAALSDAEIELAIVGSCLEQKGLLFEPVVDDQLVLVTGPNHPWRDRTSVSLTELATEPLIVRENGSGSGMALEKAIESSGADAKQLKILARLGSNEAVQQAVADNFGCAFVSQFSIRKQIDNRELFQVDVEGLSVQRQIWIARIRDRSLSPAAAAFREMLLGKYNQQILT